MPLLGGPSKEVLVQMSQGIAMSVLQIRLMADLEEDARLEMQREGSPTTIQDLIRMAAQVIQEQDIGWYKKNQFLGMIYGNFIAVGLPQVGANYVKGQIELLVR